MRTRGFTLIELLVALAIMAIISAVAVPIYTEYSVRTQRTNAEKDLMLCAQSMERLASAAFTYAGQVGPGANTGAVTANICTPTTTMYSIIVTAANATAFTIRATQANNCFGERAYMLMPNCPTITVSATARLSAATTPLTATAAVSRTRRARSTASNGKAR